MFNTITVYNTQLKYRKLTFMILLMILILTTGFKISEAQKIMRGGMEVSEDTRTVVIEPDNYPAEVGSINRTIEEEIAIDPETIFILKRDAVYFTDGTSIEVIDYRLHLRAEEGDGHPPIIRHGEDDIGQSARLFTSYNDLIFEGIYILGINESGIPSAIITHNGADRTIIFDDGYMVGTTGTMYILGSENNSIFLTNSVFANAGRTSSWNLGRLVNVSSADQDTIWIENTTMYNFIHSKVRFGGGAGANLVFINHNTGYNIPAYVDIGSSENAILKNNLYINFRNRSASNPDTGIITASLRGDGTDEEREIIIRNNNIGFLEQGYVDILDQHDRTVLPPIDSTFASWIEPGMGPNLVYEDNIEEEVAFADPPDNMYDWIVAYLEQSDQRPWPYDRWDEVGDYMGALRHYTLDDLRDFTYSTDHISYTAAENNYPLGDLNWFPELKERWELGLSPEPTSVENPSEKVSQFRLLGNYPNPFNPATQIVYELAGPENIKMEVYNMLGQRVEFVDFGLQSAGRNEASFDASGLSSGIYMIRLQAGDEVQSLRVTLVK